MPVDVELTPGELLAELRAKRGLSLRAAGKRVGVSHTRIAALENSIGQLGLTLTTIEGLARAYEVPVEDIRGIALGRFKRLDELNLDQPPEARARPVSMSDETRKVPVYDAVSAGPGWHDGAVLEWIEIGVDEQGDVAYKVDGNSMEPDIPHGSTVIVKVGQYTLGDVVVAWVPDTGMVVKRLVIAKSEHRALLASDRPEYGELIAEGANIIGKVVQMRRDF